MNDDLYLTSIISGMACVLAHHGHEGIQDTVLQTVFYAARQHEDAPRVVKGLRFDWDGPTPHCVLLDETLHGLRIVLGQRNSDLAKSANTTPYTDALAAAYMERAR